MTKKTIILMIIFFVVVALFVFLYYFFVDGSSPKKIKDTTKKESTAPTTNIVPAVDKLVKITDEAVISPNIDEKNNTIRYITQKGEFYNSDLNGRGKEKKPFVYLNNLVKIFWSEDGSSMINVYAGNFGVKRFYYDLENKNTVPLNKNINWLDYSRFENKIVYHYQDNKQKINTIAISEADGTLSKSLINTRIKDIRVKWVDDKNIEVSTAPSGLSQGILYLVNIDNPKMKRVLNGIYGLTSRWSRDGSRFIYSETDENGNNLKLMSASKIGSDVKFTGIKTLPEKCTFSADPDIVYCAEPQDLPENIIMPDDYYKKIFLSNDLLWKIDLSTGKKDLLYEFDKKTNFDMRDLYLTNSEKYIYFINRNNGFLYRLEL